MKVMFPFSPEELARMARTETESKQKSKWIPRGFFTHSKPMSRRVVKIKAESARTWLHATLYAGPKPVTEILHLAKLEGISARGLRRAKRHHGVKSIRTGGRQHGWGSQWIWHFPRSE